MAPSPVNPGRGGPGTPAKGAPPPCAVAPPHGGHHGGRATHAAAPPPGSGRGAETGAAAGSRAGAHGRPATTAAAHGVAGATTGARETPCRTARQEDAARHSMQAGTPRHARKWRERLTTLKEQRKKGDDEKTGNPQPSPSHGEGRGTETDGGERGVGSGLDGTPRRWPPKSDEPGIGAIRQGSGGAETPPREPSKGERPVAGEGSGGVGTPQGVPSQGKRPGSEKDDGGAGTPQRLPSNGDRPVIGGGGGSDMENDANALAIQRDECDSLMAIYSEDFTLLSPDPVSYSIQLRPDVSVTDDLSLRLPAELALTVRYPPTYPETIPILGVIYDKTKSPLHVFQETALLEAVTTAARLDLGMPSVYRCVQAACDFIFKGGLSDAGLSLLSDDSLAHILSFLATSRDTIGEICVALPIFSAASETNAVWQQLCRRRWGEKWGFKQRWSRVLRNAQTQSDEHFWMQAYKEEEQNAQKTFLTHNDIITLTFDVRQWFSFNLFRNQPTNMRDVLPTGLRHSLAKDVVFLATGAVHSDREWLRNVVWKANNLEKIEEVTFKLASNGRTPVESFSVHRLSTWGWQLAGSDYVLRAIDEEEDPKLWEDLTENIILEEKSEWIPAHRSAYPYQYREIPDDEDHKMRLDW